MWVLAGRTITVGGGGAGGAAEGAGLEGVPGCAVAGDPAGVDVCGGVGAGAAAGGLAGCVAAAWLLEGVFLEELHALRARTATIARVNLKFAFIIRQLLVKGESETGIK